MRAHQHICHGPAARISGLSLAALAMFPCPVVAQGTSGTPFAWIDSLVREQSRTLGLPGAGVAIVTRGVRVFTRSYGVADVRNARLTVTEETPFNIASLTKPLTSLVAMQLAREGRLSLDATATRYLDWLPRHYSTITVRQLLQHTSGIARDVRQSNEDDPDATEYRTRVIASTPSSPNGTRFEYSNTGYTVLGWILESIEGAGLDSVFRRRVFRPLGMTRSAYRVPIAQNTGRAAPHNLVNGQPQPVAYVSGGFGGGGISLSITDLSNFMSALQRGRALDAAWLDTAWTSARLGNGQRVATSMFGDSASYGSGWFLARYGGKRVLTHGGGINGYSSMLMYFPAESLSIAVIANARAPVEPILRAIADVCLRARRCEPE